MSIALTSSITYPWRVIGVLSQTGDTLKEAIQDSRSHADRSIVLGWRQELRDHLAEVICEAFAPGWDGYDATPLTYRAILDALHMIDLLPETISPPDIIPTPSGEIVFEWDRRENYIFSITVHNGSLVYAGLIGPGRQRSGQEPLGDELPHVVTEILAAHFPKG